MCESLAANGPGTIGSLSSLNVREGSTETITALLANSFNVFWAWFSYGESTQNTPDWNGNSDHKHLCTHFGSRATAPVLWPEIGARIIRTINSHVLNSSYNSFLLVLLRVCRSSCRRPCSPSERPRTTSQTSSPKNKRQQLKRAQYAAACTTTASW